MCPPACRSSSHLMEMMMLMSHIVLSFSSLEAPQALYGYTQAVGKAFRKHHTFS